MNFDFTEEQKLFADAVRKFAQAHLEKDALKRVGEVSRALHSARQTETSRII